MRLFNLKSVQFTQILEDIQRYLAASMGSVKYINKNTIFGQLMTVVSGIAHNIFLYIEDSLIEQNKYTAQRKKSIIGLAAQSGYQPSYGKAAGAWVRIAHKPNNRNPLDVVIPEHQKILCNQNGLYYNLVLDRAAQVIKCDTNLANDYFYAVQGQFESQSFTVSGGPLYAQNFKFAGFLDTDYLTVTVNGKRWTKRDSLYDMQANEEAYTVRYNPVSGCDILFGNGVYGKQVQQDDTIDVQYLLHDGESGNIDAKESVYFLFAESINDISGDEVDGNSCFDIRLATTDAVASGSNSENINQIRNMIGFNSRSLVLADANAYQAFLSRYSFVGYNRTWSEPGSLIVNSLIMRNYQLDMKDGYDYFKLTEDKFKLSDIQKASVKNAIIASGMQLAGAQFNIIDIELARYALYVYIKLKDANDDKELVSTKIRKIIGEFFGNIKSDSYIPKSDIINAIKSNIPEVDGITCYFLSERNEKAIQERQYQDKQYLYDPITGTYKTKEVTVKLNPGENPLLGLDAHGNISINADHEFPVLMGGWDFLNTMNQEVDVVDPLTIVFEG